MHTEIFPKELGRKISKLEIILHKSDYDDFYIASKGEAEQQIEVAKEVVTLTKEFVNKQLKS